MKPLVLLLTLVYSAFVFAEDPELNEILMQTTFLVKGPSKTGQTVGTAFLLLRPLASQPTNGKISGLPVLVTAAHVLEDMTGDTALIALRTRDSSGTWTAK